MPQPDQNGTKPSLAKMTNQIQHSDPPENSSPNLSKKHMQPSLKPNNPNFSSGPCAKRPGYDVSKLQLDTLGRSHRSALGKKALGLACSETARILGLPDAERKRRTG